MEQNEISPTNNLGEISDPFKEISFRGEDRRKRTRSDKGDVAGDRETLTQKDKKPLLDKTSSCSEIDRVY